MDLSTLRHSASHVLAQAVLRLYPDAKLGVGPAIDDGFYYDIDVPQPFSSDDLVALEKEMRKIIREKLPIERVSMNRADAITFLAEHKQPYKVELVTELPGHEEITFYRQGEFMDLCRGPHLENTGQLGAFCLQKVSGAYWRGKETNPMLQRIYGTAFQTQEELGHHLIMIEEAEKRDHRKLGREMDLFSIQEKAGSGLVYWHPKGARMRHVLESFWKEEHFRQGYELLYTPHIGQSWLWETSGHLGFYSENMYRPMDIDEQSYYLKPMNCPFHIMIYKSSLRSYRDLPLRWAELGTVYRYERSGVLHGLLRVRGFTQDDAHIICTPEQIESEIEQVIRFSVSMLRTLGFKEFSFYVSTRPVSFVGSEAQWILAENALRNALAVEGIADYKTDEGGGAFYGPKIDIKIKDALGREWQLSTIQFDFNMPERFDMSYIGSDGNKHRPFMIHRALLGSLERFFGILIEHYAGKFPFWLAPVQYKILTIADHVQIVKYAKALQDSLVAKGFRGLLDDRNEKLGLKIRETQLEHVPYMLIIGDKEAASEQVSVRKSGETTSESFTQTQLSELFDGLATQKR